LSEAGLLVGASIAGVFALPLCRVVSVLVPRRPAISVRQCRIDGDPIAFPLFWCTHCDLPVESFDIMRVCAQSFLVRLHGLQGPDASWSSGLNELLNDEDLSLLLPVIVCVRLTYGPAGDFTNFLAARSDDEFA